MSKNVRALFLIAGLGFFANGMGVAFAEATNEIRIVELQGTVEISPSNTVRWLPVQLNQLVYPFDRLRTKANSRVALLWADNTVVPFSAQTEIEILPPLANDTAPGLHLLRGILSFFHRDKPGRVHVIAGGALAGIEGTEFVMQVVQTNNVEVAKLSVIDGKVTFSNRIAGLVLTSGEQAVAVPGQAPMRTAGFIANNILQWCFYYPAVLDLKDLPLSNEQQNVLSESLAAYRSGDLLKALASYPANRAPSSDAEKIYHAALLLAVGQVEPAKNYLGTLTGKNSSEKITRLVNALRTLIAAVKREPNFGNESTEAFSTELLASSYYEQSVGGSTALKIALDLAKRAVTNSPNFGFGWERVAELEFSFGQTDQALAALNKSLALSPRNAQALALKGFLLAAQNKTREAIAWFNRAIIIDSALGNAWLGRGLCRIHHGDLAGGREDLLVAAALEPQRALLRSYLAKAWSDSYDNKRARKELNLAKKLDSQDPTAWLYSALVDEQDNRINEAVRDLEKSEELNDNRSVYRSQLLLDQDRAVRSANLARIYQEAGMDEVSVREAGRAIDSDYANYSAHLFLANSYDALSDPNRINLRYETPAEDEYLLANLLAPVQAGTLSSAISQQEYSKLFDRDHFGVTSDTEYLSRGAWTQSGAQYGISGNTSYSFDGFYHTDPGQRANNDFEERELSLQLKQQLDIRDTLYLQGSFYNASGGDLLQYYNQNEADLGLRTKETQEPIVLLGFHHEWSPGVHTLLLAGRLTDRIQLSNPAQTTLFLDRPDEAPADYVEPVNVNEFYNSSLIIYSGELQQIVELTHQTLIVGGKFQTGGFNTGNFQNDPIADVGPYFPANGVAAAQNIHSDFKRAAGYLYDTLKVFNPLSLTAGVSYDWILFPENFRAAPISSAEHRESKISPKAGIIWTPGKNTVFRADYTRSLSGASIDQSFQIEPSQVAGFNQSFRSLIPESLGGENEGATFETFGVSIEKKLKTQTYIGISGELLKSQVNRTLGVFDLYDAINGFTLPSGTPEKLTYQEPTLLFTVNQLLGREWSLGISYRLSQAELHDGYPAIPASAYMADGFRSQQDLQATLQELQLEIIYNHPLGFFWQLEGIWNHQNSEGYSSQIGGSDFWQFNAYVGYRFLQRRAQLQVGVLNITSQNYQLNPLNLYNEFPRQRTFFTQLQIGF